MKPATSSPAAPMSSVHRYADSFGDSTPSEAAGRHRTVEDGQIDGKTTAPHPIRQDSLRRTVQGGKGGDPGRTEEQKNDDCQTIAAERVRGQP